METVDKNVQSCARAPRGWFGPGMLVVAAFIGPGTVTTASVAGAAYGYGLVWAVLFSVVATVVLQEMAVRVGAVTGGGLGEAIRGSISGTVPRAAVSVAVVGAIGIGNAAFEAGNITGAALGLEALLGLPRTVGSILLGVLAFVLLFFGTYKRLERVLIVFVVLMSVAFVVTAISTKPDFRAVARGALIPDIPPGAGLTILALIGTTVVPYNLFLHASAVTQKWPGADVGTTLMRARWDTVGCVVLGGLVTVAVVASAAACFPRGTRIDSAAAMAEQLKPLLGAWAERLFAVGLFSAGITSAVTAPLAAAYAVRGVLGWRPVPNDRRFAAVWAGVLIIGTLFAAVGQSPIALIVFAQAANAVMLPVIAVLLLAVVNRHSVLGDYRNRWVSNVAGVVVVLVVVVLAGSKLARLIG